MALLPPSGAAASASARPARSGAGPVLALLVAAGAAAAMGVALAGGPGPLLLPAAVEAQVPADTRPDTLAAPGLADIADLAREHSPGWALIQSRAREAAGMARTEARPANPALGWDAEYLDEAGEGIWEHAVFLSTSVRLPGFRRSVLARADEGVRAAELVRLDEEATWLAEARREFAEVAVARGEVEALRTLDALVDQLETAARARTEEGEVSRVDARLLELGRYQLRSHLSAATAREDRRRARFEGRMGVALPADLDFDPHEARQATRPPDTATVLDWLRESPAALADKQAIRWADSGVRVEEGRRWPELDLMAGVQRVTPEHRGLVMGASVPLPLRDGNRAAIGAAEAGAESAARAAEARHAADRARAIELLRTLDRLADRLDAFPADLADPEPFLASLVALYEDGAEPLSGVLGSLSLLADAIRTRSEQFDLHHAAIFELEALTGRPLLDP